MNSAITIRFDTLLNKEKSLGDFYWIRLRIWSNGANAIGVFIPATKTGALSQIHIILMLQDKCISIAQYVQEMQAFEKAFDLAKFGNCTLAYPSNHSGNMPFTSIPEVV